ncbi:LysM peptidoglycan-binding domain-containing protein [bacterium]|nr:LysM peptidoglycan-binding domain-containing protein [candidate division CSSED10-310 bacterium]
MNLVWGRQQWVKRLAITGIIAGWVVLSVTAGAVEPFPEPDCLDHQVNFWLDVYRTWSVDQVVIHDDTYLDVRYAILDFRSGDGGSTASAKERTNRIKAAKSEVEKILLDLHRHPDRAARGGEPGRYAEMLAGVSGRNKYRYAADRIRAQNGLKEKFLDGLRASGRYLEHIIPILRSHGVPDDLAFLPHVESSFNVHAYSKFGAAGLWQFTRGTGNLFLTIDYEIDERRQPLLATDAAARLLRKSYDELNNWPMAITSYNHGLAGMKRAQRQLGTDDICAIIQRYNSKSFKFASRNFYTEFLAARKIGRAPATYFPGITFDPPLACFTFVTPHYLYCSTFTGALGIPEDEFIDLNPHLRPSVLTGEKRIPKGATIYLPGRLSGEFPGKYEALAASYKHAKQVPSRWHKVRRGDNLSAIAQRYGTSVTTLCRLNAIRDPHHLRIGQMIKLPQSADGAEPAGRDGPLSDTYRVQPGDSLSVIAARHGVPVGTLMRLNGITNANRLTIGMVLKLRERAAPPGAEAHQATPAETVSDTAGGQAVHVVRTGENLATIAALHQIDPGRLADLNNLTDPDHLAIGQRLRLPLEAPDADPVAPAVETAAPVPATHIVRRGDNLTAIADRYGVDRNELARLNTLRNPNQLRIGQKLKLPGGATADAAALLPATHTVRRGEHLTMIAARYGISVADLKRLNNLRNANRLAIGQELRLGTVAAAGAQDSELTLIEPIPTACPLNEPAAEVDETSPHAAPGSKGWAITVRAEERLLHYAEWSEQPVQAIMELNKLDDDGIAIGQEVIIPAGAIDPDTFSTRREEYHQSIREDFYETYRVDGTKTHVLERGETVWNICERLYGIPVWLLERYNQDVDLGHLEKGNTLVIPIVSER